MAGCSGKRRSSARGATLADRPMIGYRPGRSQRPVLGLMTGLGGVIGGSGRPWARRPTDVLFDRWISFISGVNYRCCSLFLGIYLCCPSYAFR